MDSNLNNYDIITNESNNEKSCDTDTQASSKENISTEHTSPESNNNVQQKNEFSEKSNENINDRKSIFEASKNDADDDPWKNYQNVADTMIPREEHIDNYCSYEDAFPPIQNFANEQTIPLFVKSSENRSVPFNMSPNLESDLYRSSIRWTNYTKKYGYDIRCPNDIQEKMYDLGKEYGYEIGPGVIKEKMKDYKCNYIPNVIARAYAESSDTNTNEVQNNNFNTFQNIPVNDQFTHNTINDQYTAKMSTENTYTYTPNITNQVPISGQSKNNTINQKYCKNRIYPTITESESESDSDDSSETSKGDEENYEFDKFISLSKINRQKLKLIQQKKKIESQKKNMAKILKQFGGLISSLSDLLEQ
jgi:hypothetical protein